MKRRGVARSSSQQGCLAAPAYRGPTNRGPVKRKRIQLNGSGWPGRIAAVHLSHVLAFLFSPPFRKPNLSLLGGRERERERETAMAEARALVPAQGPDEAPLDASAIRRWANDPPFPSPLGGFLLPWIWFLNLHCSPFVLFACSFQPGGAALSGTAASGGRVGGGEGRGCGCGGGTRFGLPVQGEVVATQGVFCVRCEGEASFWFTVSVA